MHEHEIERFEHRHSFVSDRHTGAERRTRWVVGLTLVMMVAEISGGMFFGSMSLLADGWHMGSHAAALGVAAFAYWFARRHAANPRYSFGTGKVGALGGFASAVGLVLVALLMVGESAWRLATPVSIMFDQAIAVAGVGLVVNLASAFILRDDHDHNHGHSHDHDAHRDHNLRAAYLHVLADALTSVLAIVALIAGKLYGLTWMDPMMGIVGALVICRWSYGLLRDTSGVLLDAEAGDARRAAIQRKIEADADNRVADLHIWRVGPEHLAGIVAVVTHDPKPPEHYKRLLEGESDLVHLTVEVLSCPGDSPKAA
ncbi:MAG: CDF family Co(II)/Ni(II) efflux transporter DmeF [Nannocystales bacterium]